MLKALGVEEVDGVCSQDLQWAVDLDMHLGAPTGRHALFAELVERVARVAQRLTGVDRVTKLRASPTFGRSDCFR